MARSDFSWSYIGGYGSSPSRRGPSGPAGRLADKGVTFKWKDYRFQGRDRFKTMTLDTAEFIRRFLLHVLPSGFHRIRHYGLFAGTCRARNIERVRQALAASEGAPQRSRAEAGGEAEDVAPARR